MGERPKALNISCCELFVMTASRLMVEKLSLLFQLLEPSCQIVKVDVVRGRGVSTYGGCGECVRNGGKFW